MLSPRVSVLIATYNRATLLSRAIESIRLQNFNELEIIIVDDGSTDNTEKVAREWQQRDDRIKYIRSNHIGRIAKISNLGLSRANGEYIAILDDDDSWAMTDKLKKQVEFLDKNPEYVGCGGGIIVVNENYQETLRLLKPENDQEIKKRALIANSMINSTTVFRKAAAEKVGHYDASMLQFADWDFWLKMGLIGKLYNFPEYFAYYLMWGKGTSFLKQKENAKSAIRIVRRYKSKYPEFNKAIFLSSLYYLYAYIPTFLKKFLNPFLSRFKKVIFSKESLGV